MKFLIIVQGTIVKTVQGRDEAIKEFESIKKMIHEKNDKLSVHLAQIIQS